VEVVGHHGEAQHIDSEAAGQELQPLFDPELTVVVIDARQGITTAEKASSDTAVDAVKDGDFTRVKDLAPSDTSHGSPSCAKIQRT
jgi:hypothetical protein